MMGSCGRLDSVAPKGGAEFSQDESGSPPSPAGWLPQWICGDCTMCVAPHPSCGSQPAGEGDRSINIRSRNHPRIRPQPQPLDRRDRTLLIHIRQIPADPHRPQHIPCLIADQHTSRCRHDAALPQAVERGDEGWALLGVQGQQAGAFAQGDGAPGFADGDLGAQQAGAVFALQGDQVPAGVQYRDGQGRRGDGPPCVDGLVDQVDCDFQG